MKIEKKIHAKNEVNRILNKQRVHVAEQLKEYINKKIYLADGSKSSKFKINFLKIEPKKFNNEYANIHFLNITKSLRSLWLDLSICFKNDDITCFYEKERVYLGKVNNTGDLIEVYDNIQKLPRYTVKNQSYLLKQKEILEKKLREINYKLVIN